MQRLRREPIGLPQRVRVDSICAATSERTRAGEISTNQSDDLTTPLGANDRKHKLGTRSLLIAGGRGRRPLGKLVDNMGLGK